MPKTPGQYKNFSTRRLRVDLHHRLRIAAVKRGLPIQEFINVPLELGLQQLEQQEVEQQRWGQTQ
jgi:hypothetical protein